MARAVSMVIAFTTAVTVVQASQFSGGGWCPSDHEPKSVVLLLQTQLQMNVLKDGGKADTKSDFLQLTTAPSKGSKRTSTAVAAEQTDKLVTGGSDRWWVKGGSDRSFAETDIGAMIVEPRCNMALPLVVWNMRNRLPSLPIQMFHSDDNADCVLAWFGQMDRMTLTRLESHFWLGSHSNKDFSWLYTTASFWDLVQHDKVLTFQADSWVCSNAAAKLKHFLKYDYVGAPWSSKFASKDPSKLPICHGVGNGGFSIRAVKVMKEVCAYAGQTTTPEDIRVCKYLNLWAPVHTAKMANVEEAKDFAADKFDGSPSHSPLGVHKPWHWYKDDVALQNNCPGLELLAEATEEGKKYSDDKTATIRKGIEFQYKAAKNHRANKNFEAEESLA